jgi:hypothetical protein
MVLFTKTTKRFMRKSFVILVAALVLLAISCKKEDEQPHAELNVQNIAGTYKISKIGVKLDKGAESDVTRFLLNTNLTYSYVDAGTSCGNGNVDGEWALNNNTTMVIADSTYVIRKFDGMNLELNHTEIVNRVSATYTEYYVKQ